MHGKPTRVRLAVPGIIMLALAIMGSDGTCVDMTGPGHGRPAQRRQFYAPRVGANRVDWCMHRRSQCGEPAATAFCQRMGYDRATAWTIAHNVGVHEPTLVQGDGVLCRQPDCDGFEAITCARGVDAGVYPAPQAGPDASFTYEPNTDRPGMNYNSVVLRQPDPKQCKKLCRQDPGCQAYTYAAPGVQLPGSAVCYLKRGVPAPIARHGCFSGVKR